LHKLSFNINFRTELLKAKGQLNVEEVPEVPGGRGHETENGQKKNSLQIPKEDETEDVIEDEELGGQNGLGVVRNRRARSYSIKGETGDVTDGRIVV
jgi:hypothetical protein